MEYQGDIGVYLSGAQVPVKGCGFFITPPTVKQVIQFGEQDFFVQVKMLSDIPAFVKEIKEGKKELEHLGDFQVLLGILRSEMTFRDSVMSYLQFCCPGFEIKISKKSIDFYVADDEQSDKKKLKVGQLNPFNYSTFSEILKELFMPPSAEDSEPEYNYDKNSRAARQLAEKIKRNRERLKKAQGSEEAKNSSIFALEASILSIGMSVDINQFFDYTPFQLYDAFSRYMLRVENDTYMKISTIPFADTKDLEAPESWYVDIYSEKHLNRDKQNMNTMSGFQQVVGGGK